MSHKHTPALLHKPLHHWKSLIWFSLKMKNQRKNTIWTIKSSCQLPLAFYFILEQLAICHQMKLARMSLSGRVCDEKIACMKQREKPGLITIGIPLVTLSPIWCTAAKSGIQNASLV